MCIHTHKHIIYIYTQIIHSHRDKHVYTGKLKRNYTFGSTAIKQVKWAFWFPSTHESYVYSACSLWSVQSVCLKHCSKKKRKEIMFILKLETLSCWKLLTIIWAFREPWFFCLWSHDLLAWCWSADPSGCYWLWPFLKIRQP